MTDSTLLTDIAAFLSEQRQFLMAEPPEDDEGQSVAEIDALLARVEAAGREEEWQPINEDTPRDGTPILVWWPIRELDEEGLPTGVEVSGQSLVTELNGGMWLEPEVLNCLNSVAFGDDEEYALSPTHWRPLPAPPAQEARRLAAEGGGK